MQKFYKRKYAEHEKVAGTKIPNDPKMWNSAVLKKLVSDHPYIPKNEIKINFDKIEPETQDTFGKIVIKNKCAIPFTIRPDENSKAMSLDDLDIIFDGEKFAHLNERSFRRCIEDEEVEEIHSDSSYGSAPPSNRYIGDNTGDVTPLEYSHNSGSYAGSRMTTASCGLLSKVVRGDKELSVLQNKLNTFSGLNSIAEAVGLNDSLYNLRHDEVYREHDAKLAHVFRRSDGSFAVAFPNGDTRICSPSDLRGVLGSDFEHVMKQVMQRGWCMVRDFATLRSVEQPLVDNSFAPIERSGRHRFIKENGDACTGYFFDSMVDFGGKRIKKQKAIMDDGKWCDGKAIVGVPLESSFINSPTASSMDTGKSGFFVNESYSMSATPNFKITQITRSPAHPDVIVAKTEGLGQKIGFMIVSGINRPQRVPTSHYPELLPDNSYYIPDHMFFMEIGDKCQLVDKARQKQKSDERPVAKLEKNANRYTLHGQTSHGRIDEQFLPEEEMRTKLAWHCADDYVIKKACDMRNGEKMDLYGLTHPVEIKKEASKKIEYAPEGFYEMVKKAAEFAAEGLDEAAEGEGVDDPAVLDSILSMQFIDDDSLMDIIDSMGVIESAEDKLARLLLAARQGEDAIHEKGVKKALKGIGKAKESIETLKIELEEREG